MTKLPVREVMVPKSTVALMGGHDSGLLSKRSDNEPSTSLHVEIPSWPSGESIIV